MAQLSPVLGTVCRRDEGLAQRDTGLGLVPGVLVFILRDIILYLAYRHSTGISNNNSIANSHNSTEPPTTLVTDPLNIHHMLEYLDRSSN